MKDNTALKKLFDAALPVIQDATRHFAFRTKLIENKGTFYFYPEVEDSWSPDDYIPRQPWWKDLEKLIHSYTSHKFCGIIRVDPWTHPCNAIVNCIAFMIDGCIQYKFAWVGNTELLVGEVRNAEWVNLGLQVGDRLTIDELMERVKNAKYKDVFGRYQVKHKPND